MNNNDRDRANHIRFHTEWAWTRNTDGLYTWDRSNNPIPTDILTTWANEGLINDLDNALAQQKKSQDAFFARYRAARSAGPSAEERASARAAHGPGVTLVDVITGQRFTT